jgi:very-short-patch-repair endonuclease
MSLCKYCNSKIDGLPFNCKRCNNIYCDLHRLPENHICVGLKKGNLFHTFNKKPSPHINKETSSKYFENDIVLDDDEHFLIQSYHNRESYDEEDFEPVWDRKEANGMNVTENRIYDAMLAIGLQPRPQYTISKMTVDFAFPDHKLVIEIDGPQHEIEPQKTIDKNRKFQLEKRGWRTKSYKASYTYQNPDKVAKKIYELLSKNSNASFMPNSFTSMKRKTKRYPKSNNSQRKNTYRKSTTINSIRYSRNPFLRIVKAFVIIFIIYVGAHILFVIFGLFYLLLRSLF